MSQGLVVELGPSREQVPSTLNSHRDICILSHLDENYRSLRRRPVPPKPTPPMTPVHPLLTLDVDSPLEIFTLGF